MAGRETPHEGDRREDGEDAALTFMKCPTGS